MDRLARRIGDGADRVWLVVGLSEALAVQFLGAEWRAGAAFAVLVLVLPLRPSGLFEQAT